MNNDLAVILMGQNTLVNELAEIVERVVMLDTDTMSQSEKDKRLVIVQAIEAFQQQSKAAFQRIEAAFEKPTDAPPVTAVSKVSI